MWLTITLSIMFGIVALDQISKLLVVAFMLPGESVELIPGVLKFTYVRNPGMAFGWLSDHRWVFMVFSVIGIGLLAFYLFRYVKSPLGRIGLSLIVGGGIGNMIDRIAYGFVVDFIDFCAFDFWKWVFNIADSAVCVGAALFIIQLIRETVAEYKKSKNGSKKEEKNQGEADGAPGEEDGQNGAES